MPRAASRTLLVVALLVLGSAPVVAQEPRTVRGEVVLADGSPVAGVSLSLQVHDGTGVAHEDLATSDAEGRALFSGVPTAPGNLLRLGASFDGVTYYSDPVAIDDADPATPIRVRVAPVTGEGRPLHLDTLHLIIQAESPTRFRVLQFMTVSNAGEAAWAGGPPLPDGTPSGLTIPLPEGAAEVMPAPFPTAADALPEGRIDIGPARVLDPRPVPPSGRQAAITYLLLAEEGPLEVALPLPYPTASVSVLLGGAGARGTVFDRTTLDRQGSQAFGEEQYEMWTAEALDPGTEVRFRIGPPAEPLLPAYGWALAGLGLALVVAVVAPRLRRPGGHEARLREEILERIAFLDLANERGETTPAEYHLARGREIERLLLLEERVATAPAETGARGGR